MKLERIVSLLMGRRSSSACGEITLLFPDRRAKQVHQDPETAGAGIYATFRDLRPKLNTATKLKGNFLSYTGVCVTQEEPISCLGWAAKYPNEVLACLLGNAAFQTQCHIMHICFAQELANFRFGGKIAADLDISPVSQREQPFRPIVFKWRKSKASKVWVKWPMVACGQRAGTRSQSCALGVFADERKRTNAIQRRRGRHNSCGSRPCITEHHHNTISQCTNTLDIITPSQDLSRKIVTKTTAYPASTRLAIAPIAHFLCTFCSQAPRLQGVFTRKASFCGGRMEQQLPQRSLVRKGYFRYWRSFSSLLHRARTVSGELRLSGGNSQTGKRQA